MTTTTKRIDGAITEVTTKRISGDITESTTKRVSGAITEDSTKRVLYGGAVSGADFDHWGGTWGGYLTTNNSSWGRSWTLQGSGGSTAIPALDITKRVDAAALTENTTKRVTL